MNLCLILKESLVKTQVFESVFQSSNLIIVKIRMRGESVKEGKERKGTSFFCCSLISFLFNTSLPKSLINPS